MSNDRRHPNVVNKDEVAPNETKQGSFHVHTRRFGPHAGNDQLGATLTEVPPGARSYPFHYHCANEESLYILSGTGTARIGDAHVTIRAGDWIAHPVGPANPHQIINDGTEPLVYLALSTAHRTELVGYPDSKKLGIAARDAAGTMWMRQLVREGESLDYWEGEPDAK